MRRRALHQDVQGVAQHGSAAVGDKQGDEYADNGVGPAPVEKHQQQGGGHGAQRAEQVAQNVQVGAFHVEIAVNVAAPVHPHGNNNVHQ